MHPALALRALTGFPKSVAAVLSKANAPLTQGEILRRLGPGAPSQSTLSRTLQSLFDMGLTVKNGATRSASFGLSEEARWFDTPTFRRPHVQYDPARIESYVPNVSRWLRPDLRDRMREAAGAPSPFPPEAYAREIAERFLIEMSWASSALEGNTYSLLETEVLIRYAERAGGRSAEEATMILNHKDAIGWLLEGLPGLPLDAQTAKRLHALLMRGLVRHDNLGEVRSDPVGITNSAYRPSEDRIEIGLGLSELVHKASLVEDPFEASLVLLCGTSYLQAFADGNKRTGRLLSSIPLLKAGLPPMSFIGVDRQGYHAGMLSWYELSKPDWVADALAEGYAVSAPEYRVSHLTRRIVRSVEIRERALFDQALSGYMKAVADGEGMSPEDYARAAFAHLVSEDSDILVGNFVEVMAAMTPETAPAYRVSPDLFEEFLAAQAQRRPA